MKVLTTYYALTPEKLGLQLPMNGECSVQRADEFLNSFGIDITKIGAGIVRKSYKDFNETSYDMHFEALRIDVCKNREEISLIVRGQYYWQRHLTQYDIQMFGGVPPARCTDIKERFELPQKLWNQIGKLRIFTEEFPQQGAISQSETLDGRLTLVL